MVKYLLICDLNTPPFSMIDDLYQPQKDDLLISVASPQVTSGVLIVARRVSKLLHLHLAVVIFDGVGVRAKQASHRNLSQS